MDINRATERPDPGQPRIAASGTIRGNRDWTRSLFDKRRPLSKLSSHGSHINGQYEYKRPPERPTLGYPYGVAWESGDRDFSRSLIDTTWQLFKLYSHASRENGQDEDQISLGPYLVRVWIPVTPALKRVGRQVERDYRQVRDNSQLKQDKHIGVIAQLTADAVENITGTDVESTSSNSNSHCCSVSKWKRGPGRSKGWKQSRFADIREWRRYSDLGDSRSRNLSQWTIDVPAESVSPARLRVPGVPSDMLRSWGHKPKALGLILRSQQATDKRTSVMPRGDSNAYRDSLLRSRKLKSEDGAKASIKKDVAIRHAPGYTDLEFLKDDDDSGDSHDDIVPNRRSNHTSLAPPTSIGANNGRQAARRFILPYESHIGAILGCRFGISSYVHSEPCYDIYVVEDLLHEQDGFAKAYTIRGTKGKERDARLKNLKRSTNNARLMASIDQNGQKWLVFSGKLDFGNDKDVSLEPLAWCSGKNYQLHFPGVDSNHIDYYAQQFTFSKSYASCFHEAKDGADDAPSPKAQRARDRQRRKRQERRVVKAKTLEAVKVKNALSEEKGGSVEQGSSLTKPDKLFRKEHSHEANVQCGSKELAPLLSDFNAASVEDIERDERQQSAHVKVAEQSHSEFSNNQFEKAQTFVKPAVEQYLEIWRDVDDCIYAIEYFEYRKVVSGKQRIFAKASRPSLVEKEDDHISIPCNAPQENCLACCLHLPKESPEALSSSRPHLMKRAELKDRNYLSSYSPFSRATGSSKRDPNV